MSLERAARRYFTTQYRSSAYTIENKQHKRNSHRDPTRVAIWTKGMWFSLRAALKMATSPLPPIAACVTVTIPPSVVSSSIHRNMTAPAAA
jgi:hypothetical protein